MTQLVLYKQGRINLKVLGLIRFEISQNVHKKALELN